MNRTEFFRTTALGGLGFAAAPAIGLESSPYHVHTSKDKSGVTITGLQVYEFKKAAFVKISSSERINGWGECDGSNRRFAKDYLEKELSQYIVGKDPFHSEAIWHEAYLKGLETGIGGLHPGSLAGVDNALWDLKGKLLGVPAWKLLGGNGKEKIHVYGSFSRSKGDGLMTPKEMADTAASFISQGYKAIKARMAIRQENVNPYPDDVYECIREIRTAIGEDILLMVDYNNGYLPADAIVMSKRIIDDFNVYAIEEPVFQQDYAGLREVVDALDVPVMAGEHEYNKWMMKDLMLQTNVDYINADVVKSGLTECRKTAAMAHAFGKQIMVHNAKPTLATAASLQLLASIPNGANFQEYAGKRIDQGYGSLLDLFENYFHFEDGYLYLTSEPGLGLVVNEKAMEKERRG